MCAVVGTSVITRHCGLSAFLSMIRWKAFVSVQFVKRDRAPLWQLALGDDLVRGPSPQAWTTTHFRRARENSPRDIHSTIAKESKPLMANKDIKPVPVPNIKEAKPVILPSNI